MLNPPFLLTYHRGYAIIKKIKVRGKGICLKDKSKNQDRIFIT